jgi:hypothetical protein
MLIWSSMTRILEDGIDKPGDCQSSGWTRPLGDLSGGSSLTDLTVIDIRGPLSYFKIGPFDEVSDDKGLLAKQVA